MRELKCPNCNANLQADNSRNEFMSCSYCGTKIMLDDYRSTYRYIDQAQVIKNENEYALKKLELEAEEHEIQKAVEENDKKKRAARRFTTISALITFLLYAICTIFKIEDRLSLVLLAADITMLSSLMWMVFAGESRDKIVKKIRSGRRKH